MAPGKGVCVGVLDALMVFRMCNCIPADAEPIELSFLPDF